MIRSRLPHAVLASPLGFLFALALSNAEVKAQTSLSVGDVQILGVTADSNDSFAFVLWKDVVSGTVIRFTDNSFTSSAGTTLVSGSENDMSITFTSAASAGTVIRFEDTAGLVLSGGVTATASSSLNGTSDTGDQVFAYQGSAVSGTGFSGRTLLYGFNIANTDWLASGGADSNNSYLPTALGGLDASFDSGNFDNADYTGARSGLTIAAYRAAVGNVANFTTQSNTRFNLSTTSFTTTSAVNLTWDGNGTTAGTGGSGTWDTTTQSRFSNSANTTFLHWVNSTAGSDQSAVFAGTAGTVSVAAGGVTASGLRFEVNGYTLQNNTITLLGATPTVTVTNAGDTAVITSAVATTGTLLKDGAGKLIVSGALSGAVEVSAGLFGGGGTSSADTAGAVTVNSGATLDPGSNPGTGTGTMNTGDFSLLGGGHLVLQLGGTAAGTQFDRLNVTGTISLAGDLTGSLLNGYQGLPGSGDKLFILVNNGTDGVTGAFSNTFLLEGKNAVNIGAASFFISYLGDFDANATTGGNDVVLYSVPEPRTVVTIGGGIALLLGLGRVRRRRFAH